MHGSILLPRGDDDNIAAVAFPERDFINTEDVECFIGRPIDLCAHMLVNNPFNGIITDLLFDTHVFDRTVDTLHQEILFVGVCKLMSWVIPRQFLCCGWVTATIGTAKALRL